jgi:hypothetical protein
MAYDDALADRVRAALGKRPGLDEKRMFGGLAFLLNGHMCCGIMGAEFLARVPRDETGAALQKPHTRPFDFTGKPMKAFVVVEPAGLRGAGLGRWVEACATHVAALPPKEAKVPKPKRKTGIPPVAR